MNYLFLFTIMALTASVCSDNKKTLKALKISGRKLVKILPAFFIMLIFVSLMLYFIPDSVMLRVLDNENQWLSLLLAAVFGSITLMPGFIAFPMCGLLLSKGVGYMVIAMFTTTLMMVGVLTYPIERAYFGTRLSLLRNLASLVIALLVAVAIGLFYGELI